MKIKTKNIFWCMCGNSNHPHKGIRNKELHGQGRVHRIVVDEINFCCSDMKGAYEEEFIVFGKVASCGMNMDDDLNITKCEPYPEGACWDEMAIRYCPFCGTRIEISLEDT